MFFVSSGVDLRTKWHFALLLPQTPTTPSTTCPFRACLLPQTTIQRLPHLVIIIITHHSCGLRRRMLKQPAAPMMGTLPLPCPAGCPRLCAHLAITCPQPHAPPCVRRPLFAWACARGWGRSLIVWLGSGRFSLNRWRTLAPRVCLHTPRPSSPHHQGTASSASAAHPHTHAYAPASHSSLPPPPHNTTNTGSFFFPEAAATPPQPCEEYEAGVSHTRSREGGEGGQRDRERACASLLVRWVCVGSEGDVPSLPSLVPPEFKFAHDQRAPITPP